MSESANNGSTRADITRDMESLLRTYEKNDWGAPDKAIPGVYWNRTLHRWQANYIPRVDPAFPEAPRRLRHIGYYSTERDAQDAYDLYRDTHENVPK